MKYLTIFDATQARPAIDPGLGRLDADSAAEIADYLDSGRVVISTTMRVADCMAASDDPVVPVSTLTDGEYVWSQAVGFYIAKYHISPGEEFIRHCEGNAFRMPEVSRSDLAALAEEVLKSG